MTVNKFNKNITILELNEENFEPYGKIVDIPSSVAAVEKLNLTYWHELYKEELKDDICLGFLQIRNQQMVINEMERHLDNCEIFIPVSGKAIMPFAPANCENDIEMGPDESKVVFFILDGSKSFLINKGVWHTPALPLAEAINFLMVLPKGILNDIDNRLVKNIQIED